jgi:hypothetical protein
MDRSGLRALADELNMIQPLFGFLNGRTETDSRGEHRAESLVLTPAANRDATATKPDVVALRAVEVLRSAVERRLKSQWQYYKCGRCYRTWQRVRPLI